MTKKIVSILLILCTAAAIVMLVINHNRTAAMKNFLTDYYSVSDSTAYQEFAKLSAEDIPSYLHNRYGDRMTESAIETAAADRRILAPEQTADEYSCTLVCNDVSLGRKSGYYSYTASVAVTFADGHTETLSLGGQIAEVKDGGAWKVDSFRPTESIVTAVSDLANSN